MNLEEIAEALGIDSNDPLPDFSDPETIRRLEADFTETCAEELWQQHKAELESWAGLRDEWVG